MSEIKGVSDKKIDEVIVKVWDMAQASKELCSGAEVRQNTLTWAREELRVLCQGAPHSKSAIAEQLEQLNKNLKLIAREMTMLRGK